jgi:hypothetical protein
MAQQSVPGALEGLEEYCTVRTKMDNFCHAIANQSNHPDSMKKGAVRGPNPVSD